MEQQKWISVDEKMPDNCEPVLVYNGLITYVDFYDYGLHIWYSHIDVPDYLVRKITHWMPRPKPPIKNEIFDQNDDTQTVKFDRATALAVLKEFSRDMYPSLDLFGNKTLVIRREKFEAIRKKYLG